MDIAATAPLPGLVTDVCRHCGDPCGAGAITSAEGDFCCHGCETVFTVLQRSGLGAFYSCEVTPGTSQKQAGRRDVMRFAVLDDAAVAERLITFNDGKTARATFAVPSIHCSSCVWLLEQLWRFDDGITRSEVDLLRRAVRVDFNPTSTSLRRIAEHLTAVGYEPSLSPEDAPDRVPASRRTLHLQIGVAGFAFGNIMLFSIPRYANGAPLDPTFQRMFDFLNVLLAIPVLLFSAAPYFRTAWEAIRGRSMAIEVPVALGLAVLFVRSLFDITTGHSEGFFDSFAGLVFFLLLGRLFQHKVFDRIAFDRTYRSFLPLSVRVERAKDVEPIALEHVRPGDYIQIRPGEVVPADAILTNATARIDYAFVTGEQTPVRIAEGDIVRAGGRAVDLMRLRVLRDISHSHLASLWNNPIFAKTKSRWLTDVASRFGAWFTSGAVGLAIGGAIAWWPETGTAASVATAVLIIACPCALTLSAPITLGTAMGLMGTRGLYLKHPAVAFDLSRIDTIAFDKTGTLTETSERRVIESAGLDSHAWAVAGELARHSTHPVSRALANDRHAATELSVVRVSNIEEAPGRGIAGLVDGVRVAIGTTDFVGTGRTSSAPEDRTFVRVGDETGWVRVSSPMRPGVETAARALARSYDVHLLSGDHDTEQARWLDIFGRRMRFRQTPQDKLDFISASHEAGHHILMIGDGLNDSGALAAADVGVAVSDETACMVPACDAVIAGERVAHFPAFLRYARRARTVVWLCFIVSVLYNVIGLTLALRAELTPIASAILMPLSSLTIIGLSWGAMQWSARRILPS
ncbi:MAG TPA: heavy metal translocating P-type ATPase metal-binding domain-containing protein [Vicinamibacterales bacterium]|nr:heavy metal translocating P-type ATPase metal-binding domain-containing protein [Vicinamibacterales bacterium]